MENEKPNIKTALKQLISLKQEKIDKETTIASLEAQLKKMEENGYEEIDSVTGGDGGKQHFKISGFPYPAYSHKKDILLSRKIVLGGILIMIDNQIALAEELINEEKDSRIRRMLTYRFIDGLTWRKVADKMGGNYTEDNCRVTVDNFLK